MEQQPSLTTQETGARPASVVSRTAIGVALVAALAGLLYADQLDPQQWLPTWAEGLTGLHDLLEDGLLTMLVVAVLTAAALREYGLMRRGTGVELPCGFLMLCGVVLLLLEWVGLAYRYGAFLVCPAPLRNPGMSVLSVMLFATLALLALRALKGRIEGGVEAAGALTLGLVYVPVAFGFLAGVRVRWGVEGVVTALAVCKLTDIGAYYAGTLIGGPLLAPRLSPRKTWAGAVGGTAFAVLASLVLSIVGLSGLRLPMAVLYGLLLGPVAVLGDLAESLLKRQAGVKDSGSLLHGYGGVLDMVDDVLFAAPFSYLFFALALTGGQG